jgi:hypothetical protein
MFNIMPYISNDDSAHQIEGEIGRRMQITMKNNSPHINNEKVFLKHFRQRHPEPNVRDGFVGIGMLLDALVRLAYESRDDGLIQLKLYMNRPKNTIPMITFVVPIISDGL